MLLFNGLNLNHVCIHDTIGVAQIIIDDVIVWFCLLYLCFYIPIWFCIPAASVHKHLVQSMIECFATQDSIILDKLCQFIELCQSLMQPTTSTTQFRFLNLLASQTQMRVLRTLLAKSN